MKRKENGNRNGVNCSESDVLLRGKGRSVVEDLFFCAARRQEPYMLRSRILRDAIAFMNGDEAPSYVKTHIEWANRLREVAEHRATRPERHGQPFPRHLHSMLY